MSLPRFLVPTLPSAGVIELPENEAHHASRVLRCAAGDQAQLFDGQGNVANVRFAEVSKRHVSVSIESKDFAPLDHDGRLHFAVALPKGDRQRNTVEKLVELGVDSLTPISTHRSVAVVDESNLERLDRYSIEASKQCGRNRLMRINPCVSIESMKWHSLAAVWILHPYKSEYPSMSVAAANEWSQSHPTSETLFLVGPEGGFTEEEAKGIVQQGGKVLSLGDRIQRVETAVSTAAVLGSLWLSAPSQKLKSVESTPRLS